MKTNYMTPEDIRINLSNIGINNSLFVRTTFGIMEYTVDELIDILKYDMDLLPEDFENVIDELIENYGDWDYYRNDGGENNRYYNDESFWVIEIVVE